jgi:hypothetical protein
MTFQIGIVIAVITVAVAPLCLVAIRLVRGPAARITVDGADLTVHLGPVDKALALRGDVRIPLASVQDVKVTDRPLTNLRGVRAPGFGIPDVLAYGTWRHSGGLDFVAALGRGPALLITTDEDAPFRRLLVGMPDPAAGAALVQAALH